MQRLRPLALRRRRRPRRPSLLAIEDYGSTGPADRYAEVGALPPVEADVRVLGAPPASPRRPLAAAS